MLGFDPGPPARQDWGILLHGRAETTPSARQRSHATTTAHVLPHLRSILRTDRNDRGRPRREARAERCARRHERLRLREGSEPAPHVRLTGSPAPSAETDRARMAPDLVGAGARRNRREGRRAARREPPLTRDVRRNGRGLRRAASDLRAGVHAGNRLAEHLLVRDAGLRESLRDGERGLWLPVHAAVSRPREHELPDRGRNEPGRLEVDLPAGGEPGQAAQGTRGARRAHRLHRSPAHRIRQGRGRASLHPPEHGRVVLPRVLARAIRNRRRRSRAGAAIHDRPRRARGLRGAVDPGAQRTGHDDPRRRPPRARARVRRGGRCGVRERNRRGNGNQRHPRRLAARVHQRRQRQPRSARRHPRRQGLCSILRPSA